ncbi:ABC transporter permease [Bacillus cereus group sp. BfR-BA-01380]|uniref:ABC transporter permease n=1 Tax=Bacillus cereus group sp. BfR-BA-01380 TaxID=2920324 RepID=UPI001F595132|nr:ABC transporter permease [Bacillus cereus group sp. BfR-BA-01380]
MRRLILSEIERIYSRKSTKVLFVISVLFPIFSYLLFQLRWNYTTYTVDGIKFSINSLNYPITQMSEYNALLIFILLPLFFSESLSSEIDSGAYKMILLRPLKKWKLIVSKWISLATVYTGILLCTYLTNVLIGYLLMPKVEYTVYYNIDKHLNLLDSTIYNLKCYLIMFGIHIALLAAISLLSVIVQKPILTFLGSIALLISGIYLFEPVKIIFFQTSDIAFSILGGAFELHYVLIFLLVILLFFSLSLWIWNKRIGDIA